MKKHRWHNTNEDTNSSTGVHEVPAGGVSFHGRITMPFRLGTSSFIIPDDILPNLRHLRGRVDDVELVLFESDALANIPSAADVTEMAELAVETDLTYTVHLPLDIRLGSGDEAERLASVGKCRRVIQRMTPIRPFAWILHLHGDRRGDPPSDNPHHWNEQNRRSLEDLLDNGPPARKICIETLDYNFTHVAAIVEEFDLSVCLDIGHLLIQGRDVEAYLDRWMDRARVFHLHGVDGEGKDHCHLGHLPEGLLENLATRLSQLGASDERVVTMEVFGVEDFERSITTVTERLATWRKSF